MSITYRAALLIVGLLAASACAPAPNEPARAPDAVWPAKTHYRELTVRGRRIFYREAGDRRCGTLLLLHGFPSSSHTYRELIPLLSGRYHVVAPDYLGSGFSDHPSPNELTYTFDLLADHVTELVRQLALSDYLLYMQDFGAPVGFRVAMAEPERVRAIVVQNANAYLDGLTPPRREFFWLASRDRSPARGAALAEFVSDRAIVERQYLRDVPGAKRARMSPDAWTHDIARMPSESDRAIQVQLFRDYQSNIDAYPRWQAFLRARRPPLLVLWGRHDPAFITAGAKAYLRDVPDAELHLLDAGHFAVEEQPVAVAQHMIRFIERKELWQCP